MGAFALGSNHRIWTARRELECSSPNPIFSRELRAQEDSEENNKKPTSESAIGAATRRLKSSAAERVLLNRDSNPIRAADFFSIEAPADGIITRLAAWLAGGRSVAANERNSFHFRKNTRRLKVKLKLGSLLVQILIL